MQRYILKEHIGPFGISLVMVTFVILLEQVLDILNVIFEKHLPIGMVLEVFGLSLPFILALSIPMSVLMASLNAFGRLSTDNETTAMKACGVDVYSKTAPLFVLAVLLALFMVFFNNRVLPDSNHKLRNMMLKIAYYKPMSAIKPGEFTTIQNYTIYVRENDGNEMRGIVIFDNSAGRFPKSIVAERGTIIQSSSGTSLKAELFNGQMHERDKVEFEKYQLRNFDKFVLNISEVDDQGGFEDSSYRGDRELSSEELGERIESAQKEISKVQDEIATIKQKIKTAHQEDNKADVGKIIRSSQSMLKLKTDHIKDLEEDIRSYKVEIHKKYAISFAIIIFVMIGIPLGMMTKTGGAGVSFTISSIVFLIYYISLVGGESLASKGFVSPFLSMWISNIIFFLIAIFLIYQSRKEKQLFDTRKIFKGISKLFGRKNR
ncbi:MAG: LptF/LptG family permease [Candidatus Cloacimonetes bacterium]|nr:LptF/LptG family permease [Candidatus Cloacimonadota bacterium]